MGVRVRLRPLELSSDREDIDFEAGEDWFIHDDHTLEIRDDQQVAIAFVHKDRWDVVQVTTTT